MRRISAASSGVWLLLSICCFAQSETPAPVAETYSRDGFLFRPVTTQELEGLLRQGTYIPVPAEQLQQRIQKTGSAAV
ncbi:MAG: hypothetical protein KDA89_22390, partial [Planctomycetaceae bacterium]|nr:hypothetical protein [Planctomycetaceae bacterium]